MNDYPENWLEIANEIKHLSHWHCENCGKVHDPQAGYCLTVHHLDGDKANCKHENLAALCQRCHLRLQAQYKPGQSWLPGTAPKWAEERGLT